METTAIVVKTAMPTKFLPICFLNNPFIWGLGSVCVVASAIAPGMEKNYCTDYFTAWIRLIYSHIFTPLLWGQITLSNIDMYDSLGNDKTRTYWSFDEQILRLNNCIMRNTFYDINLHVHKILKISFLLNMFISILTEDMFIDIVQKCFRFEDDKTATFEKTLLSFTDLIVSNLFYRKRDF